MRIKGLKVNLWKTKVIFSGGITKDGISKSKVDPCWVCTKKMLREYWRGSGAGTVGEFTYLGDKVSTGGRCEAALTA